MGRVLASIFGLCGAGGAAAQPATTQVAEVLVQICGYTNVGEMPGGYAEYLAAEPAGARAEAR